MSLNGIIAGWVLGDAGNRADAAERAKGDVMVAQSIADRSMNQVELANELVQVLTQKLNEKNQQVDSLEQQVDAQDAAVTQALGINVRAKADDVGLRSVIRAQMEALRRAAPNNPLLDRKMRDHIFGETVGAFLESNPDAAFPQVGASAAGLQEVIHALDNELQLVDPSNPICDLDERYVVYWIAFDDELARQSKAVPNMADKIALINNPTYNRESLGRSPFYKQRDNEKIQSKAKVRRGGPGQ